MGKANGIHSRSRRYIGYGVLKKNWFFPIWALTGLWSLGSAVSGTWGYLKGQGDVVNMLKTPQKPDLTLQVGFEFGTLVGFGVRDKV